MDSQYATSENYSTYLRDSPSKWNGKDGKGYVYKQSSYKYSNAGNHNPSHMEKSSDRNIDQLDELLLDLKNERQHSKDIDFLPSSTINRTIERERIKPPGTISKTTHVIKTSQQSESNQAPIEIENIFIPDYSTFKSSGYSSKPSTLKKNEYQVQNVSYGSSRNISDKVSENKNNMYESSSTFENIETMPSTGQSSTQQFSKELQNIALSDDILPLPGTKVTTTVRTYTYEIPADASPDLASKSTILYKSNGNSTIQRNETNQLIQSRIHPPVPQTIVYNTESYSTIKKNEERPIITNNTKEIRDYTETHSNRHGGTPHHQNLPAEQPRDINKTIIYKENNTENIHHLPEPVYHRYPSNNPNYAQGPTTNRYYYHESSNVINTINGPGSPVEPHGANVPSPKPPHNGYPLQNVGHPPQSSPNTSSIVYKYSTTSKNSLQGPDYGPSALNAQPAPFPVDGMSYPVTNGSPPQRVDDLMESFGNGDSVDKADFEVPHRKREVVTAVAKPNQQKIPSVNKPGKEVYYPPGHEMMLTQREEMAAGSAAGGRWAKGSGMYEYESGYKSKSKTKSGGAVVPVCLPLCCAMPCSIM